MRITLSIDDVMLEKAQGLTGVTDWSELVRRDLIALIERESAKRLARLGGSQPDPAPVSRHQTGYEQRFGRTGCPCD